MLPGGARGFLAGGVATFRGARDLLLDPALRRLAVLPVLITGGLYSCLTPLLVIFGPDLLERLWARPPAGGALFLWWLVLVLMGVVTFGLLAMLLTTIIGAIGGPFFDRMARRVLAAHGLAARDPGVLAEGIDLVRALAFLVLALLAWAVGLAIPLGGAGVLLGVAVSGLGLASSAINPALMASGVGLRERLAYLYHSFAALAGLGMVLGVALLVPLGGLVAFPCAVVGAADLYARARKDRAASVTSRDGPRSALSARPRV